MPQRSVRPPERWIIVIVIEWKDGSLHCYSASAVLYWPILLSTFSLYKLTIEIKNRQICYTDPLQWLSTYRQVTYSCKMYSSRVVPLIYWYGLRSSLTLLQVERCIRAIMWIPYPSNVYLECVRMWFAIAWHTAKFNDPLCKEMINNNDDNNA